MYVSSAWWGYGPITNKQIIFSCKVESMLHSLHLMYETNIHFLHFHLGVTHEILVTSVMIMTNIATTKKRYQKGVWNTSILTNYCWTLIDLMGVKKGVQGGKCPPLDFGNILLNVLIILFLTIYGYETIKMTLNRP